MNYPSRTVLALLSGGLDSTTALWMAKKDYSVKGCLTFDYGQRAAEAELRQAQKLAAFAGIEHRTLSLPFFSSLSSSGLLSKDSPLPHLKEKDLDDACLTKESSKAVWVPNRNGVFIEVAAAYAEARGIDLLVVGFNAEEAETFPDNSKEFLNAINHSLSFSTQGRVQVISPTGELTKSQIVRQAKDLGVPLSLLWSCYERGEQMCGQCESCGRLKRALRNNEVRDDSLFAN